MEINVLPWREARRHRMLRLYGYVSGGLICLACIILCGLHTWLMHRIRYEMMVNRHLQQAIAQYDATMHSIAQVHKKNAMLTQRLSWFEHLSNNQQNLVGCLKELPRWFNEGIYLTTLLYQHNMIHFNGYAVSDHRLSKLLKTLNQYPCMHVVGLPQTHVESSHGQSFNLDVTLKPCST